MRAYVAMLAQARPRPGSVSPNRRPRRPKVLKVGSDFSGVDTACIALSRMGIEHQFLFASDVDVRARMVLKKAGKLAEK